MIQARSELRYGEFGSETLQTEKIRRCREVDIAEKIKTARLRLNGHIEGLRQKRVGLRYYKMKTWQTLQRK